MGRGRNWRKGTHGEREEGRSVKEGGRGLRADPGRIDSPSCPPPAWAPVAKSKLRGSPAPWGLG